MRKQTWIGLAATFVVATVAAVVAAAPNDRPGSGNLPAGNDDDNFPPSCLSPTLVNKVMCPATLQYTETTSTTGQPPWTPTTSTKTAPYIGAITTGTSNKTLTCSYTPDGTDRLVVTQTSTKSCAMSKKFRGFNCCK